MPSIALSKQFVPGELNALFSRKFMKSVTVAALQRSWSDNTEENVQRAEDWIRISAAKGAQLILLPELFESPYFCKEQRPIHFDRAHPVKQHPTLLRMQQLARELTVVLPVSFFEQAGPVFFNSLAMIDADGELLGLYRKSHIPDGPGYQEKFYFSPGDTGFRVWMTRYGCVGVGICWDQWFPEAARCMVLKGAEILLYPTAIGSEPSAPGMGLSSALDASYAGSCSSQYGPSDRSKSSWSRNWRRAYT
jgi:N-carbamoylputrescine amidase